MASKAYGSVNMRTGEVKINKSLNKSGMEYLDTAVHESNHFHNPKMSERAIIRKTEKDIKSYLAVI